MANKYFYFIKLKDGFYDIPEIKVLLSLPCGYAAVAFLQKLMLEARNHEGYLRLNAGTPYTVETLCPVINFPTDLGRECEKALSGLGLVKWIDGGEHDGDLYIPMTADCIGSESESTIRSRKSREAHSQEEGGADSPAEPKNAIGNKTETAVQQQCNGCATAVQQQSNGGAIPPSTPTLMKRLDTRDQSLRNGKESPSSSSKQSSATAEGDNGDLAKAIDGFYEAYPKKSGIGPVRDAVASMGLTARDLAGALVALEGRFKGSANWLKAGGRFAPLPENWLRARPWTEADCKASERREEERRENERYSAERAASAGEPLVASGIRIPEPRQIPGAKP